MWTPSSESEETSHLNVKQANEIALRQIKNAALTEREGYAAVDSAVTAAKAAAVVSAMTAERETETETDSDSMVLKNLLDEDVDGQEEMQQLLPQSTGKQAKLLLQRAANEDETHAAPLSSNAPHQDTSAATTRRSVINVGSQDNVDNHPTVQFQQQKGQLKTDQMTQYGNAGSYTHSKLDIQKVPEGSQHQEEQLQNNIASLKATTTMTTATPTIAQGVGVGAVNTGNINNELNGPGLPSAHAATQYKGPKFWQYIQRNWFSISEKIALFFVFLLLWALAYCYLPEYAHPNAPIMRLIFLIVGAEVAGLLVTFLLLPDMLGMLFFGVLYTNVGLADFKGYQTLEGVLRELALINIMLLAGLGLDGSVFKKMWAMISRLTVIPTIAEVAIIMVLAKYTLGMPWLWGILLGLVITAVSPNVVVTVMLKLKEDRLGMNNGIHTIIYATTTCNDVLAIFAFGVVLGVVFSKDTLTQQILQGPVGIGIGIVFGYVYGMLLSHVPSPKSSYTNGLRFVLTILGGCIAVMGSRAIGYPSAGALGCASLAFIASIGWKRQERQLTLQQQHANENSSVPKRLDLLWKFLKPVSFALIGKEINFATLNGEVVGYGLLLIVLGSLFRLAFAYVSTRGGGLTWKERAYITISGFPKATVQAALGPLALDAARALIVEETNAQNVLIISVLAIIFTAPLGAILMLRLAPLWLQRQDEDPADNRNVTSTNDTGNENENGKSNENSIQPRLTGNALLNSASNLSFRSNKSQCTIDVAVVGGPDVNARGNTDVVVAVGDDNRQNSLMKRH